MNLQQLLDQVKTDASAKECINNIFKGVNFDDPRSLPDVLGKFIDKMKEPVDGSVDKMAEEVVTYKI